MILNGGVRTTEPVRVAYRQLSSDEDEAKAITDLLSRLTNLYGSYTMIYDHSMVVNFDPPGDPERKREVMIPVPHEIEGVETKVFPSLRAAFLVFKGVGTSMDRYYKDLWDYIEEAGLEHSDKIYSIEIMYVPEDVDNVDYTMEIMIPLKS
ncbi:MAG: GyrI-like domain-containing protein [Candidatus Bathyarchaeia archaeon]